MKKSDKVVFQWNTTNDKTYFRYSFLYTKIIPITTYLNNILLYINCKLSMIYENGKSWILYF